MKNENEYRPQLEKAVKDLEDILSNYSGGEDKFGRNVFQLASYMRSRARIANNVSYGHGGVLLSPEEIEKKEAELQQGALELLMEFERIMSEWKLMQENVK